MNLSDFAPFVSIRFWLEWLRAQPPTVGLVLAIAGGLFMFLGLRISRVAILLTGALFGLVAWMVTTNVFKIETGMSVALLVGLIVVLAGLSQISVRVSAGVSGGVLAALATGTLISWAHLPTDLAIIVAVVAAISVAATAFVMYEHVLIFMTSFEGSLLFVGGIAIMLNASGSLFSEFREASLTNPFFIPLTLIAPTVIGFCLQLASFREKDAGKGDA